MTFIRVPCWFHGIMTDEQDKKSEMWLYTGPFFDPMEAVRHEPDDPRMTIIKFTPREDAVLEPKVEWRWNGDGWTKVN